MIQLKKAIKIGLFLFLIGVLFFVTSMILVFTFKKGTFTEKKIYDYGVVFGAAIRPKGKLSNTLESRMKTAIKLYQEGSVKKLVLSGAVKNQMYPGEPKSMYDFALAHGVKPEDLIIDEQGDSTFETIINTKKIIPQSPQVSILFISSFFHLARIQLTAKIVKIPNFSLYPSEINHPKIAYFVFREAVALWYYVLKAFYYKITL